MGDETKKKQEIIKSLRNRPIKTKMQTRIDLVTPSCKPWENHRQKIETPKQEVVKTKHQIKQPHKDAIHIE